MFNRCVEDEQMLSLIAHSSRSHQLLLTSSSLKHLSEAHPLLIIDARPYANACANKVSGAGFEDTAAYYQCCRVSWVEINRVRPQNIVKEYLITIFFYVLISYRWTLRTFRTSTTCETPGIKWPTQFLFSIHLPSLRLHCMRYPI